jgi:hypothetical protein
MERGRRNQGGRLKIPVEVDDEDGFTIDESRLDTSLRRHIDELAEVKNEEKAKTRNQNRREKIAYASIIMVMAVIVISMLKGAYPIGGTLLILFAIFVGDVIAWVEKA